MSTTAHPTRIVHRIEHDEDRHDVLATTYQMRNFYRQFGDGYFSRADVFNYLSHHQIARWAAKRPGARLLDVCCGRGLMLPLLRYHAKDLGSYTGLDIEPKNAVWRHQRVTDGKPVELETYYPFACDFVAGDVAEAERLLAGRTFDFVVYTASIEHMHPDHGTRSLHGLRTVVSPTALLVLTAPNTPEDRDGYETSKRAHVYEWKLSELRTALDAAGWQVLDVWGVDISVTALAGVMRDASTLARLRKFIPPDWLGPMLAAPYPEQASEVGLLCMPA